MSDVLEKLAQTLNQRMYQASRAVDTSATKAQRDAGNYAKGHARLHGMSISIENPRGSTRSGTDKSGKKWSRKLTHHYGYIRRTVDKDGDHMDCFVGPHPQSELVFVVDQIDPKTKLFDEHKVILGARTKDEAREIYTSNYDENWQGLGKLTSLTLDQFKAWLADGVHKRPLASQVVEVKAAEDDADKTPKPVLIMQHRTTIQFIAPKGKGPKPLKPLKIKDLGDMLNDWIKLPKDLFAKASADKPIEKAAAGDDIDVMSILQSMLGPVLGDWMRSQGYSPAGLFSGQNVADLARDKQLQQAVMMAMRAASEGDRAEVERFARGLMQLQGKPWTPGMEEQTKKLTDVLIPMLPWLQRYFKLPFGTGPMAGELAKQYYYNGVAPEAAAQLSQAIVDMYRPKKDDPPDIAEEKIRRAQGFTSDQLAQILPTAISRGLIAAPQDQVAFVQSMEQLLPVMAEMRSQFQGQGLNADDMRALTDATHKMVAGYGGDMNRMARQLAMNRHYQRMGGRGGLMGAAMREAGVTGLSEDFVAQRQAELSERAAKSQGGRMVAALAQLDAEGRLDRMSPAGIMLEQLRRGEPVAQFTPARWMAAVTGSNVTPQEAATVLNRSAANAVYLTPELVQAVRGMQGQDFDKAIQAVNQRYGNNPYSYLRRGALDEVAYRAGYKGGAGIGPGGKPMTPWQEAEIFHGRAAKAIPTVMAKARTMADESLAAAHTGSSASYLPLRNLWNTVANTGPKSPTTGTDLLARTAGGARVASLPGAAQAGINRKVSPDLPWQMPTPPAPPEPPTYVRPADPWYKPTV
jgi:hypothetical protein